MLFHIEAGGRIPNDSPQKIPTRVTAEAARQGSMNEGTSPHHSSPGVFVILEAIQAAATALHCTITIHCARPGVNEPKEEVTGPEGCDSIRTIELVLRSVRYTSLVCGEIPYVAGVVVEQEMVAEQEADGSADSDNADKDKVPNVEFSTQEKAEVEHATTEADVRVATQEKAEVEQAMKEADERAAAQ